MLASSFDPEALAAVRAAGAIPTALVGESDPAGLLSRAGDLRCAAVFLHYGCCDRQPVERAGADGRSVYAWAIRERAGAARCVATGVDRLVADAPGLCDADAPGP